MNAKKKKAVFEIRGTYTQVYSVYGRVRAESRKAAQRIIDEMTADDSDLTLDPQDGELLLNIDSFNDACSKDCPRSTHRNGYSMDHWHTFCVSMAHGWSIIVKESYE